ncbi:MAG: DUF4214 domain-containing protein [Pikeienuella sp.]
MAEFLVTTLADEPFDDSDLASETGDGAGLSLREAVALANALPGAESIRFADGLQGSTIVLGGAEIGILDDLDIAGDITISGGGGTRIFQVVEGIVSMSGLTIAEGAEGGSALGGGIFVGGATEGTLTGMTFRDNAAGNGGAIANEGLLEIHDSRIVANQAGATGGAISNREFGIVTIEGTLIEGNTSGGNGGGIYNAGGLVMSGGALGNNSATGVGADGGGLANVAQDTDSFGEATLSGVRVFDNQAAGFGGGIANDGILNLSDVSITGNATDPNSATSDGGGLYNGTNFILGGSGGLVRPTVNADDLLVSGNSASDDGGGIANFGQMRLSSVVVDGNRAGAIGENASSPALGGGIYSATPDGDLILFEATVANNVAETANLTSEGGGIYAGGSTRLTNVTLANNEAYLGGGLHAGNDISADVRVTNATITGNQAAIGGGVYTGSFAARTVLSNSVITGNSSDMLDIFGRLTPDISARASTANVSFEGANLVGQFDLAQIRGIIEGTLGNVVVRVQPATVFASVVTVDPDGIAESGDEFAAGRLANNGGARDTVALRIDAGEPDNPAIDAAVSAALDEAVLGIDLDGDGAANDQLVNGTDARGEGYARRLGSEVDIGAFEVLNIAGLGRGLSVDDAQTVAYLYEAALNRDGNIDLDGLNFWIDAREGGFTELQVAEAFLDNPEFTEAFGPIDSLSDLELVEQLYRNVLDREGEQDGIDFWTGVLGDGASRAFVVLSFAESPENVEGSPFVLGLFEEIRGEWAFA